MTSIWVFDVASMDDPKTPNGVWYEQKALGSSGGTVLQQDIPSPRSDFCLAGLWTPDGSSYNMYVLFPSSYV
jgi:hypothetical protein